MPHNGYRPFDIFACRTAFADFTYTALPEGIAKAQREPAIGVAGAAIEVNHLRVAPLGQHLDLVPVARIAKT